MKSIKEKEMLVKWAKAMNEPIDPALVEEVEKYQALQKSILESVKQNLVEDLAKASKDLVLPINEVPSVPIEFPRLPSLEDLQKILEEDKNELVQPQTVQEPENTSTPTPKTIIEKTAEHITKEVKLEEKVDSYQQPDASVPRNINDIKKKIKYLEDWISKISLTGPGGGAGDVINLDHPVKLITNDYTITRKDYYIGVNANKPITITLLDSIGFPGRKVVIKDESGNCSSNPITVLGNVDNDAGGFILQMDNGGIQMIYREGWRII